MAITASMVKELRDRTGAGMMDCKRALSESDGDMEAAIEYLQIKGIAKAAKKAGRIAAEGLVDAWVSDDHKQAVMVEVNCETDFVAKNEDFQKFVKHVTETVGKSDAKTLEEALKLQVDGKELDTLIKEQVVTIGENIQLRRVVRLEMPNGFVSAYIHNGAQIGVLTAVEGEANDDNQKFGRNISMHTAGMKPLYLDSSEITDEEVQKQEEIFTQQMIEEGKDAKIVGNIVKGKINKWKKEISLYDQDYIINPDLTIRQHEEATDGVKLSCFVRWEVGEGIEKAESNLAEEVAAQLQGR